MIFRDQPSALHLFFVVQGSIVPKILGKILGITAFSIGILLVDRFVLPMPQFSMAAMGVFGVALSLFLGFRNNAAYDRWWEARKLWGAMIADMRNLGRQTAVFVGDGAARDLMLSHAVAFAHLHRGYLRGVDTSAELEPWVGAQTAVLIGQKNPADAALRAIADQVRGLVERDAVSGFGQMALTQVLGSFALAQAGCERISTTPLPFVYSLLVRRTTYLYCWLLPFALMGEASWFMPLFVAVVAYVFFGLQAVTNELEQPFRNVQNGLPLDAMCRVIEISACEAMGRPAPDGLQPINHVLS